MADVTDKFKKVGESTVTTLSAPGKALGATTLTVGSTTNYPTTTGIIIAMRVVDTNGELVAGTYTEWSAIVTSGTGLTIVATPVYGSDQVYAAGSTTQVFIPASATQQNTVIDGILVGHDQTGVHKTSLPLNSPVLTTPALGTPASGVMTNVTGIVNAGLATGAGQPGGAWDTWTPTWAGLTVGNGTTTAKYTQIGKTIHGRIKFVLGSTSSVTGFVSFSTPAALSGEYIASTVVGTGTWQGAVAYFVFPRTKDANTLEIVAISAVTADLHAATSSTVPGSLANGHSFFISFTVEAA